MKADILVQDILGMLEPPVKALVTPYRGAMIYGHKTGGVIQVMNGDTWNNWKGYQPGRCGRSATKKAGGKNTAFI